MTLLLPYSSACLRLIAATAMLAAGGTALAHPGHATAVSSNMLITGLQHPLTGIDHMLAMLAVGLWTTTRVTNRPAAWRIPASFLVLMFVGALAGLRLVNIPAVEPMIVASLLVFGLLLATRIAMPDWVGAVLVGAFALFHGIAHGAELAAGVSIVGYVAGFMFSTLALILTGMAAGHLLRRRTIWLTQLTGASIAAYGLALWSAAA